MVMSRPREITKKLREADPELSMYVKELERVNLRLQKQIVKLGVDILKKQNEIKALKKQLEMERKRFKGLKFEVEYVDKSKRDKLL